MHVWIKVNVFAAVILLALAITSALLFKYGIVNLGLSILGVQIAFGLSALVAILAVLTILVQVVRKRGEGLFTLLAGFLVSFFVAGFGAVQLNNARNAPPIHNITTDLVNPPVFREEILALRGPSANSVDLGEAQQQLHAAGYPEMQPLVVDGAPADVYAVALSVAKESDWEIVVNDPTHGAIQGTDTTFWFGYKDDVAIRVRPNDDGSQTIVDLHSVSRIGLSDLGKNADRISKYLRTLSKQLEQPSTEG